MEKSNLIFIAEIGLNHNGNFDAVRNDTTAKKVGLILKVSIRWKSLPHEINLWMKK